MTDKDVNTVCSALKDLSFQELLLLYRETVGCSPNPVATSDGLILTLKDWIHNNYFLQQRLSRIARLYSRLATIGSLKPWTLYRLRAPMKESDAVPFLNILSNEMEHGNFSCTHDYYVTPASVCCSVLLSDGPLAIAEHRLVCFNVWPMHPFLAVHAPGMIAHSGRLYSALVSALGHPEHCVHGYYGDLLCAIADILGIPRTP